LVTTPAKFSGQFKSDSKCPMCSTYKLCSHTIAVAEVTGKLKEFTQWLIKQKCAPNYSITWTIERCWRERRGYSKKEDYKAQG